MAIKFELELAAILLVMEAVTVEARVLLGGLLE